MTLSRRCGDVTELCRSNLVDVQRKADAGLVERVAAHDDLQRPPAGEGHRHVLGPVLAGVMISAVGTGWAFIANALSR